MATLAPEALRPPDTAQRDMLSSPRKRQAHRSEDRSGAAPRTQASRLYSALGSGDKLIAALNHLGNVMNCIGHVKAIVDGARINDLNSPAMIGEFCKEILFRHPLDAFGECAERGKSLGIGNYGATNELIY